MLSAVVCARSPSRDIIGLTNPVYGDVGSFRDDVALATITAHNQAVHAMEEEEMWQEGKAQAVGDGEAPGAGRY